MEVSSLHVGWTGVLLASALVALYVYYSWTSSYAYWKQRNVPYLKPTFPFGNVADVFLLKKNFRQSWLEVYNRLDGHPFGGIFSLKYPVLIVRDPKLIKLMLTKDFSHFVDRGFVPDNSHEPLMNSLVFMEGESWKRMRFKLSPTFTSGKMKMMFPIMKKCSKDLELSLTNILQNKGTFEAKDLITRYTFDTIVTCFFGLKPTATGDANCELYKTAKQLFEKSLQRAIANIMFVEAPNCYSLLKLHFFKYDACERIAEIVRETIEFREKHGVTKNDFLDLMIRIKKYLNIDDKDMECEISNNIESHSDGATDKSEDKDALTLDDILSQTLGFFVGGFETSSSGLYFCLYELGRSPDVQTKMQRELHEAYERHGGVLTYHMLQELPYFDNVINETMRMYSSIPVINRLCIKAYRIPDTDVVIEKGCRVVIPSYGLHHDPKYYPEPFKFDPDKFLEENVKSRPTYTFLPFGEGPRICIGMRFAKMQMKLALVTILSQFSLTLNPKTSLPLTIERGEFFTRTRDDILIDLQAKSSKI